MVENVRRFGNSLQRHVSWTSGQPKSLAILLPSSSEWLVAYQACIELGIVVIPLTTCSKIDRIAKILNHSKTSVVLTTVGLAEKLAIDMNKACSHVKQIILAGTESGSNIPSRIRKAAKVAWFEEYIDNETKPLYNGEEKIKINPSSPAYVIYHDNQMNEINGVVITHSNALSVLSSFRAHFPQKDKLTSKDNYMCAISMAYTKSLNFINVALATGCTISIYETEDGEKLINQAFTFRPTFTYLSSVLVRDCCDLLNSSIDKYPKLEHWMFMKGWNLRKNTLKAGRISRYTFFDFAYFHHFNNFFGGKMRTIFVSPYTFDFDIEELRVFLGCQVLPTLGSTATTGAITCSRFYDYGQQIPERSVGPPLACNELKLVALSDSAMETEGYSPHGEIYVRGPNVATAYWNPDNNENKQQPLVNSDGWHATGLAATLLPNRTLYFIGCTREIIITPTGKISHLHSIEEILTKSPYITQIALSINALQTHCDALVFPKSNLLLMEAKKRNCTFKMSKIAEYPWCLDLIRQETFQTAKENNITWIIDPEKTKLHIKLWPTRLSSENAIILPGDFIDRNALKKIF